MCEFLKRDYYCQDPKKVGPNTCKHDKVYVEQCPTSRASGKDCKRTSRMTTYDTWPTCYDAPGCCEIFLYDPFKKWAKYRKERLRGGYDSRSRELGETVKKVYHQHKTQCEKLTQGIWQEMWDDVHKDYGLPDIRLAEPKGAWQW